MVAVLLDLLLRVCVSSVLNESEMLQVTCSLQQHFNTGIQNHAISVQLSFEGGYICMMKLWEHSAFLLYPASCE
jgi:hypothetical protein